MKTTLPLHTAKAIAGNIIADLALLCPPNRITVAGSIRREQQTVGDIEIVAIPNFVRQNNMTYFGWSEIDIWLESMEAARRIVLTKGIKNRGKKRKYVQFDWWVGDVDTVQVDLFLQPDPRTWPVNLMIRTGSSDFSRLMVTKQHQGGFMPNQYTISGALVWEGENVVPIQSEKELFEAWGLGWIHPTRRAVTTACMAQMKSLPVINTHDEDEEEGEGEQLDREQLALFG